MSYLNYLLPLIEGASVVITAAFILFRLPYLQQDLLSTSRQPLSSLFLILFFSLLAIYGTHAGVIISPDKPLHPVPLNSLLNDQEAILNFRDLAIVCAGLVGGLWVGLIVGLVAAIERYLLGGNTALACAAASFLIGIGAGQLRHIKQGKIQPSLAAIAGTLAVLLQMLLILLLVSPFENGLGLVQTIALPVLFITAGGSALFIYVLQLIDSDRTKLLAYYNAQIEPHFLMNSLNAIRSLIRLDPDKARHYVTSLGEFMQETQRYARSETITVKSELAQTLRYMDFQRLRFPDKISHQTDDIDPDLLNTRIPPRTILTLVENALVHGKHPDRPLKIALRLYRTGSSHVALELSDNGVGIPDGQQDMLGKKPIDSAHKGGGRGLYNLSQALSLSFGDRANLAITPGQPEGTTIKVTLPTQKKGFTQ